MERRLGAQPAFCEAWQFAIQVLREPLFRFLVIGAALFAAYGLTGGDSPEAESRRITISTAEVELLRGRWTRQWLRPPSEEELQALVQDRVREEVLYREALAMGLDRDDSMIRQRLAQKLKFLAEDVALAREPAAGELEAYFAANDERYRVPPLLSFSQVFFHLGEGREPAAEPKLVLARLRGAPESGDPAILGDRSLLESRYRRQTPQEIAAMFGEEFAAALLKLKPGAWSGPITSEYGLHLVRIEEQSEAHLPAFADMAEEVRADWANHQRRQANEAFVERLLGRYEVTVEPATPSLANIGMTQRGVEPQP
jgi:hypothetical protein